MNKHLLANFFWTCRDLGRQLENAMQDLGDVCADRSLSESPAVKNLIHKVQFVMDRAQAHISHVTSEEEQVEFLEERIRTQDEIIRQLQLENQNLRPSVPEAICESGLTATEQFMVRENQFINAIKHVRGRTGMGLKESKDLVEAYRDSSNIPF